MTTKPNPLVGSLPIEIRISADPRTGQLGVRCNRPIPTLQAMGMLIDALTFQFQYFVKQSSGIVGQDNPIKLEPSTDIVNGDDIKTVNT